MTSTSATTDTGVADETSATGGSDLSCCGPHPEPGCEEPSVASCVCEIEASCCAFGWEQVCVNLAEVECGGCEPEPETSTTTTAGSGTGGNEDCCSPSMAPGCSGDPPIEDCVCALDPYCCDTEWDGICVAEAQYECMSDCGLPPPGGDCCMPHAGPECDDVALTECVCNEEPGCCLFPWSEDCIAVLVNQCGGECEGFIPPDPCCMPSMMPGCATMDVEACVCGIDPFCCDTEWDGQCVTEAQVDCGLGCYPPGTESCCNPHMSTGCDVPEVQACVCGLDPFCCDNEWDAQCVDEANNDCGGCMGPGGPGDCCMANGTPGCDDAGIEACVCASLPSCCGVEWQPACVDEANLACMAMCAP
ncbi:MAG: hypothetical protein AB1Z98_31100 [Nannocystaceae bacterium]